MKIGVDAGCLGIKDKRLKLGVYQFTYQMLREMGKIKSKNQFLLYSFYPLEKKIMRQFGPRMKNILVKPRRGWNHLALPLKLMNDRPDFFIGPSQSLPSAITCPSIVVVHDLMFERFPRFYSLSLRQLRRITKSAIKKATKTIAVSQATKKDLINYYHLPARKIKVIYSGCDPIYKPQGRVDKSHPYFLYVGALKKTKNIPGLLRAFAKFEKKFSGYRLILAGSDFWLDGEIGQTLESNFLENKVTSLGFVKDRKLPMLYSQATAFISPSFCEGFGLTNLEAMSCGCPVIAGNQGAEPEIVGPGGILVNPENTLAIYRAMVKISSPAFRAKLSKLSLKQAHLFSWQATAQQMAKTITECVKKSIQRKGKPLND